MGMSFVRSIAIISSQAFSLINFRGPLIHALKGKGIKVYALAPDFNEAMRARVEAMGAVAIDYSLARAGVNPLRDLIDIARLADTLKRLAPDVMLAYFIKPVIYGSIAAWLVRIPRRFSIVEGLGYVFMDGHRKLSFRRCFLRYIVSRLYRFALRLNERVFFLNSDDVFQFRQSDLVDDSQVVQIDGIGLDLDYYSPVPPILEPVTFLLIARMLREKGVCDFVEAARRIREKFPGTEFILVGGTDPNPGSVSELDLKRWVNEGVVKWLGQVDDVRPWIAKASVFVLPSYYREGVPRSSQEAMAMARPVITTDWVGCRETVKDGVNGFLVPVRDPSALAKAMERFLLSVDLIANMGREGRRIAEERFDARVITRQIVEAMEL